MLCFAGRTKERSNIALGHNEVQNVNLADLL